MRVVGAVIRVLSSLVPHEAPLVRPLASEQFDDEAEMVAVMGKNFDKSGSFGPWMVSADELPAGGKGLKIMTRLNGNTVQSDNTDNMMFPLAEMLVYVTKGITLEPGDIILTGTPSGVGHARKPDPIWMRAGDVCEIEVEGIGVLRNPIEDQRQ